MILYLSEYYRKNCAKNYFFPTAEPLPLMELCRRVIRQNLTKERIAEGKIDSLVLPKSIKEYLEYKDRRPLTSASTSGVTSAGGSPIKS